MSADTERLIAECLKTIRVALDADPTMTVEQRIEAHLAASALAEGLEAGETPVCPDCGIPLKWCRAVTSNPEHCWRWDYERFDETASALEAAETQRATLAEALPVWIESCRDLGRGDLIATAKGPSSSRCADALSVEDALDIFDRQIDNILGRVAALAAVTLAEEPAP